MANIINAKKRFWRLISNRRFWELAPILSVVFLLPFLHGGESEFARVIFLAFPIFYLPILFWRKRKVGKGFMPIFWAWLVFLGVNLVSTIFSASIALSVPQFMELLGVFVYFVFFYLVIEKESDLKLIAYLIVFVGFLLSLTSFIFIAFPPPSSFPGMNLVYAKFGHNHLSDWLIFVLPIVVVQFIASKTKRHNLFWGFLILFFLVSFFLTFARGAFLAFSIVLLAILWIYKPRRKKLISLFPFVLVPILAVLGVLIFSQFKVGQEDFVDHEIKRNWLLRQVVKPFGNEARFEYWQQAVEGFKLRPIKGNGPGTFRLTSKRFQRYPDTTSWYTHNFLLQTASEAGVLGIVTSVIFLGFTSYILLKNSKGSSHIETAFKLGLLGVFLQSLVDFNLDFLVIYLLFWIVTGSTLVLERRSRRETFPKTSAYIFTILSLSVFVFSLLSTISSVFLLKAEKVEDNSLQKTDLLNISLNIFPFSESTWVTLLESFDLKPVPNSIVDRASFFNRQSPKIINLLADGYTNQNMWNKAKPFYLLALSFDHSNIQDSISFIEKGIERKDYEAAQIIIDQIIDVVQKVKGEDRNFEYEQVERLALFTKNLGDYWFETKQTEQASLNYIEAQKLSSWILNEHPPIFVSKIYDPNCKERNCSNYVLNSSYPKSQYIALAKNMLPIKTEYYSSLFRVFEKMFYYYLLSSLNEGDKTEVEISFERLIEISHWRKNEHWQNIYDSLQKGSSNLEALKIFSELTHKYWNIGDFDYRKKLNLAKLLYLSGLEAYNNNELDLTISLWENASLLAPDWSYFHIELANLYLTYEEKNEAMEQIETCLKFRSAKEHCNQFSKTMEEQKLDIGVFKKIISDI